MWSRSPNEANVKPPWDDQVLQYRAPGGRKVSVNSLSASTSAHRQLKSPFKRRIFREALVIRSTSDRWHDPSRRPFYSPTKLWIKGDDELGLKAQPKSEPVDSIKTAPIQRPGDSGKSKCYSGCTTRSQRNCRGLSCARTSVQSQVVSEKKSWPYTAVQSARLER